MENRAPTKQDVQILLASRRFVEAASFVQQNPKLASESYVAEIDGTNISGGFLHLAIAAGSVQAAVVAFEILKGTPDVIDSVAGSLGSDRAQTVMVALVPRMTPQMMTRVLLVANCSDMLLDTILAYGPDLSILKTGSAKDEKYISEFVIEKLRIGSDAKALWRASQLEALGLEKFSLSEAMLRSLIWSSPTEGLPKKHVANLISYAIKHDWVAPSEIPVSQFEVAGFSAADADIVRMAIAEHSYRDAVPEEGLTRVNRSTRHSI